ncbi:MAG: hypothetical protein KDC95_08770 [Planctomycetes bacterium]|nr:hypothetical protein [Planctomycetota bacterium]
MQQPTGTIRQLLDADRKDESIRWLVLVIVVATPVYGFVLGSYSGRPLQSLYSALKLPILVLGSGLVVTPFSYVMHAALGVADDYVDAWRATLAAQATMGVCLAAASPLVALTYVSIDRYSLAVLCNGLVWMACLFAGQIVAGRHYRDLAQKNPVHRKLRRLYAVAYAFVVIQLAWMLRPFVGDPELPVTLFRDSLWQNAYVTVTRTILEALRP